MDQTTCPHQTCHGPAGITDNLWCRNGAWTPVHTLAHTFLSIPFHFLLLIPPSFPFKFHLFLSYPSDLVVFNFQSLFLKLLHWALISLLYQVPVLFSSPSGSVFISSLFILLAILMITFTFPVFLILVSCLDSSCHCPTKFLALLDLFFSSCFLFLSHVLAPSMSWLSFHRQFPQNSILF